MSIINSASSIITALGGDTSGMCRCPVAGHGQGKGDRNPSLWISPEGRGLKCWAGCSYKAVVAAIKSRGIKLEYKDSHSSLLPHADFDLDEAQRFLDLLAPKATSWTFQTFADDHQRKKKQPAKILHGTLSENAAWLKKASRYGSGIFVCPNRTDLKGRQKKTSSPSEPSVSISMEHHWHPSKSVS